MRSPAKPKVNLYVQVPPEISELRCRLQGQTGFSGSQLVSEALLALAARLGVAINVERPSRCDRSAKVQINQRIAKLKESAR